VVILVSIIHTGCMKLQSLHAIMPKLIKRVRIEKSMSQEDLAHAAGLDRTYISGFERGVRNITLKSLDKIIESLHIDAAELAIEIINQCSLEKEGKQ